MPEGFLHMYLFVCLHLFHCMYFNGMIIVVFDCMHYTVEPLFSGHRWDSNTLSSITRCPYLRDCLFINGLVSIVRVHSVLYTYHQCRCPLVRYWMPVNYSDLYLI